MGENDLNLSGGSAGTIITETADYLGSDSKGLGDLFKALFGSGFVGVMFAVLDIFNAIVDFLSSPLESAGSAISSIFTALLNKPASILGEGATQAGQAISSTFTGFLGVFAFPAAVASVLLGLYLVNLYIQQPSTSDLFPGAFSDINTPDWAQSIGVPELGVTEEDPDDEQDQGS